MCYIFLPVLCLCCLHVVKNIHKEKKWCIVFFRVLNVLWYCVLYFTACGTCSGILCYIFLCVEGPLVFCVIFYRMWNALWYFVFNFFWFSLHFVLYYNFLTFLQFYLFRLFGTVSDLRALVLWNSMLYSCVRRMRSDIVKFCVIYFCPVL